MSKDVVIKATVWICKGTADRQTFTYMYNFYTHTSGTERQVELGSAVGLITCYNCFEKNACVRIFCSTAVYHPSPPWLSLSFNSL